MSNNTILNRLNQEQLHHIKSLSTDEERCAYATSIGVALNKEEAAQISGEIGDEQLEKVNGGAGYRRPIHK